MVQNRAIRWTGTIGYMIGILYSSAGIYPMNIAFGVVGSVCWLTAGILSKDRALITVEGFALLSFILGLSAVFFGYKPPNCF